MFISSKIRTNIVIVSLVSNISILRQFFLILLQMPPKRQRLWDEANMKQQCWLYKGSKWVS